jgi:hypothetical protein
MALFRGGLAALSSQRQTKISGRIFFKQAITCFAANFRRALKAYLLALLLLRGASHFGQKRFREKTSFLAKLGIFKSSQFEISLTVTAAS